MCKEIKRLTLLSECTHLNKTDRDAITFILRETGNITVEPDKGFDGFDFSSWPEIPNKNMIRDWVRTRKSKGKSIITQTFIDSCAIHLQNLNKAQISVDMAISFAASDGWQGFQANWVLKEIEKNTSSVKAEDKSNDLPKSTAGWVGLIVKKQVTHRSQIPEEHRLMIDTAYRIGKYEPSVMEALERIGFAV